MHVYRNGLSVLCDFSNFPRRNGYKVERCLWRFCIHVLILTLGHQSWCSVVWLQLLFEYGTLCSWFTEGTQLRSHIWRAESYSRWACNHPKQKNPSLPSASKMTCEYIHACRSLFVECLKHCHWMFETWKPGVFRLRFLHLFVKL